MSDYTKKTKDGVGFFDNGYPSDFNFNLEDDITVSPYKEGGDGRTKTIYFDEDITVFPNEDNSDRTKERKIYENLTIDPIHTATVSVVYEGTVGVYLSSDLYQTDIDLTTVDVETYIRIYDDGTIEFPDISTMEGLGLYENVGKKSHPAIDVENILGTYYGRVPIDIKLYGSGVVDFSIYYLKNGVWKRATVTNASNLEASSSSSSFSLSSSSSSSSSESYSSSSVSFSSESISSSSISFSSESSSSSISSILSSSSSSISKSSISSSSSSIDQRIFNKHRIWWESCYDLYESITTKLKISVNGFESYYVTDSFYVSLDVVDTQFPVLYFNNGEKILSDTSPVVSFVSINPMGYSVEEIKIQTSQYHSNYKYFKEELFSEANFDNTIFNVNHVRLYGDTPLKINNETLVTDGLIFAMHMDDDRDWINNQLTTVTGTYVDDLYGNNGGALNFSSNNDMIDLFSDEYLNLDGIYTVVVWFEYPLSSTSTWNTMIRGSSKHHPIIVRRSDMNLGFYDNDASTFLKSDYSMSSLSNGWHCMIVEADGEYSRYYIDDEFVGKVKKVSNEDIRSIGNYWGGGQHWGKIDEFRLYDRLLDSSEKTLLYTGGQYLYSTGECSGIFDAGVDVDWKSFDSRFYVPNDTFLKFYFRTSLNDDHEIGLNGKDWCEHIVGDLTLKRGRFLEWKAEFVANELCTLSPRLYFIKINYENLSYLHGDVWRNVYPVSFRYDTYSDWKECEKYHVSINENPGSVLIDSYINGVSEEYWSSGYLKNTVDAGRDVNWGFFESTVDDKGYANIIIYQFRSSTNNEGPFALNQKSFITSYNNSISVPKGRYLEWKIILEKTPIDFSPVVENFNIWCWNKKVFYNTESDWNEATTDFEILINSKGEVSLGDSGGYFDSGEIYDTIDVGSNVEWKYWLIYDNIQNGTNISYYYKYASESEGLGSLSGKSWNRFIAKTGINGINARYLRWKAILESDDNNLYTPRLIKFIFSWNADELESFNVAEMEPDNLGRLVPKAIGNDVVHSRYDASSEFERYVVIDDEIIETGANPIFTWDNATDNDIPRQDFKYVFQLLNDEEVEFCDDVFEYVKSMTSELNEYQWKDDSISIFDNKVFLDDSVADYGRIVYRLSNSEFNVWSGFLSVDNDLYEDHSQSISYFIRFSDNLADWSDWEEVYSIDTLCHRSKYFECMITLKKHYGVSIPEFYSLSVEALSGSFSFVVQETDSTTSFDSSSLENLSVGHYYYRVVAYDGTNFSSWSRTHVIDVVYDDVPENPSNLRVDGVYENERVISFSPDFTWDFNHVGHNQDSARVQVGNESGLWNVWDSGKASTNSGLEYGQTVEDEQLEDVDLKRGMDYYWRVRVWNELNKSSGYSLVNKYRLNQLPTKPKLNDVVD